MAFPVRALRQFQEYFLTPINLKAVEAPPYRVSGNARNQVTPTRRAVAVSRDRNTIIRHRRVAFLDDVWRHVGMLRARDAIAFASDIATVESHCRRRRNDFATVVGVIVKADQIHHESNSPFSLAFVSIRLH